MQKLPWSERVNMLSINPDAATREDIARMAAELSEAKFTSTNPQSTPLPFPIGYYCRSCGERFDENKDVAFSHSCG